MKRNEISRITRTRVPTLIFLQLRLKLFDALNPESNQSCPFHPSRAKLIFFPGKSPNFYSDWFERDERQRVGVGIGGVGEGGLLDNNCDHDDAKIGVSQKPNTMKTLRDTHKGLSERVCVCVRVSVCVRAFVRVWESARERERDIKSSSCNKNAQEAKCGCRSRVVGHSFLSLSSSLSFSFSFSLSASWSYLTPTHNCFSSSLFLIRLKSTTSLHLFSPQKHSFSSAHIYLSPPFTCFCRIEDHLLSLSLSLSIVGRGCVSYAASCLAGDETCSQHIKNNNHSLGQPQPILWQNRDINLCKKKGAKMLITAARETIWSSVWVGQTNFLCLRINSERNSVSLRPFFSRPLTPHPFFPSLSSGAMSTPAVVARATKQHMMDNFWPGGRGLSDQQHKEYL